LTDEELTLNAERDFPQIDSRESRKMANFGLVEDLQMVTVKQVVESLLSKLPDDCSLEDIQYHLYVLEKVRHGLEVADTQGAVSQEEAERRLEMAYPRRTSGVWRRMS